MAILITLATTVLGSSLPNSILLFTASTPVSKAETGDAKKTKPIANNINMRMENLNFIIVK
jgi:hypothetical protein